VKTVNRSVHKGSGLRAAKREDKQRRIRSAARKLFSERGYDQANVREIAAEAGVGLGTMFHYARDKRDLVFLIFNEEFARVVQSGLSAASTGDGIIERLLAACAPHYHFFNHDVTLSRILLRELIFYSEGVHSADFLEIRRTFLLGVRRLIRQAQADGEIRTDRRAKTVAEMIFLLFAAQIRWWIASERPDATAGLNDLRRLLQLTVEGIGAER
jgi:AcrR family transcriptional regulator